MANFLEDATRKSALAIQSEAKRIAKIIRELLDFARQTTPNRDRHALNDIIASTANLMRPLAAKHGAEIKLDLPQQPLVADFDSGQIQQVLTNLIVNAVQSTGRQRFNHHHVVQRLTPNDLDESHGPTKDFSGTECPYCKISIRDNGVGMADAIREHIFEPFFHHQGCRRWHWPRVIDLSRDHPRTRWLDRRRERSRPGKLFFSLSSGTDSKARTRAMSEGSVLIVDDEQAMCELIDTALAMRGYDTAWCQSADTAMELLRQRRIRCRVDRCQNAGNNADYSSVSRSSDQRPDIPVVVMTAFGSMETAVSAMRSGAYDFITKPVEMELLSLTMARAVERRSLTKQIHLLKEQATGEGYFGELLGESEPMKELYQQMTRLAASEASILITGESGTGKELGRAIDSPDEPAVGKPFVAVNCAALSETLLESELFGHLKGAFTDARSARAGLFLEAEGGTLILDELGDMPMAMQVKLLRALEENRLRPVGSDQEIEFDVRVLAATHRDLETAVEEGRFRQDLFYRINVIQLHLPPLRARSTDILILAGHYVEHFASRSHKPVSGIAEPAAKKLLSYSWPGNVRELRNVMERAVALTPYDTITLDDLPDKIRQYRGGTVFIGGEDPTELGIVGRNRTSIYRSRAQGRQPKPNSSGAARWASIVRHCIAN